MCYWGLVQARQMLYHWAVASFCIFQNIETEIMFRTTYHYPARRLHFYILCYFCTPSPEVLASPLSVMGLGTSYFTSKARFKSRKAEYSGLSVVGVDNPPYRVVFSVVQGLVFGGPGCCRGVFGWMSESLGSDSRLMFLLPLGPFPRSQKIGRWMK